MTDKTQEEWEKEQEQLKILYILKLGATDKDQICQERCMDMLCSDGCLQQRAKLFRPQIMRGVKVYREKKWNRYPLYGEAAFQTGKECEMEGIHAVCKDPVCQAVGCLEKPAWHYRDLIKLGINEE